jgi:Sensors of blue-light using FAD
LKHAPAALLHYAELHRQHGPFRVASPPSTEAHAMSSPHFLQGDEPGFGRAASAALYNVVYCSRATAAVDDAEVQRIVATARRCNAEHGITGMLVFGSGIFFQWLEGARDDVTALMALLRHDPRHENIVELSAEEDIGERLFPTWDMELVTSEHIREVLQDAHGSTREPKKLQALERLLAHLNSEPLAGLNSD